VYGLITRLRAKPGQREELGQLLEGGLSHRPGCLSYIVALDTLSRDALWITEVWMDEDAYRASLTDLTLKAFTTRAWPMIAGVEDPVITTPIGGLGLG
jgi:quinol monooxygenase YgiN